METKTHWKQLTNPNYLGSWNIGDELILTIKTVSVEQVHNGKEVEPCTVCNWVDDVKPMILNKTNQKAIAKALGTPYIEDWSGKKIRLITQTVKAFGDRVEAIRVDPKTVKIKKSLLTPEHPKWEQAKAALAAGNTSIETIRKHYQLSKENEALLCK